jgi:hypothetical protein
MAKQLNFEYNGKKYCLEYTRQTVRDLENSGFKSSDLIDKPLNSLPKLFAGAFKAHHRWGVKPDEIEKIFDSLTDKEALLEKLASMYNEPMEALLNEPDEGNAIAWEANF